MAHRVSVFARGDQLRRHRGDSAQHHRAPAARAREGVIVDAVAPVGSPDADDLQLLTETLRKAMATSKGQQLDKALAELGWLEMLEDRSETAIPLVFGLIRETGAH